MLSKKVAVITGASAGIGETVYHKFLEKDILPIQISRSVDPAEDRYRCDITNEDQVKNTFGKIIDKYKHIDILVNNAGVVSFSDIETMQESEWDKVVDTNLKGSFLCCKYCLPVMKKQRYGKVIQVSSIAGRSFSQTASAAYTASKYGLIGLTKQLAYHYARYNININAICPSQTMTNMLIDNISQERLNELAAKVPAKRLATPEDIAGVVYFLTTDDAAYVNGAAIDINGGQL